MSDCAQGAILVLTRKGSPRGGRRDCDADSEILEDLGALGLVFLVGEEAAAFEVVEFGEAIGGGAGRGRGVDRCGGAGVDIDDLMATPRSEKRLIAW